MGDVLPAIVDTTFTARRAHSVCFFANPDNGGSLRQHLGWWWHVGYSYGCRLCPGRQFDVCHGIAYEGYGTQPVLLHCIALRHTLCGPDEQGQLMHLPRRIFRLADFS